MAWIALAGAPLAQAKGPVDPVLDMTAGLGSTWAVSGLDLVQIGGRSGEPVGRTRLGPASPLSVAAGAGAIWVVGRYFGVSRRFAALWQVDPATGRRVGRAIGMDAEPVGVAAVAGTVWVLDRARGRLLGFSARTRRLIHEIAVGRAPMALEAGAGAIWVTRAGLRRRPVRHGSVACTLVRVDPRRGSARELRVPRGCLRDGLAVTRSAVWIAGRGGLLTRVGPAGRQRRTWRVGGAILALAARGGRLWLARADGRLDLLAGGRRRALVRLALPSGLPPASRFGSPVSLIAGGRWLWSTTRVEGTVARLSPGSGRLAGRTRVSRPVAPRVTRGTRIHGDDARGIAIPVPTGWRVAPRSLTPSLSDPHELVSLATGPMPTAARDCAHMPGRAIDAAAPAGAFVSVQERSRSEVHARRAAGDPFRGFPRRPARWRLAPAAAVEGFPCVSDPRVRVWWRPFRQGGRAFYLLVALGRRAGPARRAQALAIVNGLRIRPGAAVGLGPWLRLPRGWLAESTPREDAQRLVAATVPIAPGDGDDGANTQARLGPGDIVISVTRYFPRGRRPESAAVTHLPLRFRRRDFPVGPFEGQRAAALVPRWVVVDDQLLFVTLGLGPAPPAGGLGDRQRLPADADALIARANAVLATLVLAAR